MPVENTPEISMFIAHSIPEIKGVKLCDFGAIFSSATFALLWANNDSLAWCYLKGGSSFSEEAILPLQDAVPVENGSPSDKGCAYDQEEGQTSSNPKKKKNVTNEQRRAVYEFLLEHSNDGNSPKWSISAAAANTCKSDSFFWTEGVVGKLSIHPTH